ncbi:MAG: O-methyltransferase [Marinilabiliaceae bacterium]|nr:O-methyltransferase [Marinilabiliaceae bacterium]
MDFGVEKLDNYILDHITEEDQILKELNRQTHLKILRPRMLSGHLQGQLLYLLCKMLNPTRILEIGTFTGYSAICMAKGLADNGRIDTIEVNDELVPFTKSYFERCDVKEKIQFHIGSAIDIIPKLTEVYDLIFIDGDKRQYPQYYHLCFEKLRRGGFILADNILWDGKVINDVETNDLYTKGILEFNELVKNDSRVENVILPIRDGISLIRKK